MSKPKRIAFDAMLAAVYFALSYLIVPLGGLQIRFTAVALIVAALLFGPADACAVALVGEGLYQTLVYGVTVTTPIWLLPPLLHAAYLGVLALVLRRRGIAAESKPWLCYLLCISGGLLNTVLNTAALYADSRIMGYYDPSVVFGLALIRIALGMATAAVTTAVARPLVLALRRRGV